MPKQFCSGGTEPVPPLTESDRFGRYKCPVCNRMILKRKDGKLRSHRLNPEYPSRKSF